MRIIPLRLKNVSCYLIEGADGFLAFDLGWTHSRSEYKKTLSENALSFGDIKWCIASHYHIDHAGLARFFQDKGAELWVIENQLAYISDMEALLEKKNIPFLPIDMSRIVRVKLDDSRSLLHSIGIEGRIIKTNGHGEHSVTLLLDTGEAFVGDLPPEEIYGDFDPLVSENWKTLRSLGAKTVFTAHAGVFEIERS